METQLFRLSTKWLHEADVLRDQADEHGCVAIQIPKECCESDLIVNVGCGMYNQDQLQASFCEHFNTYPGAYINRIQPQEFYLHMQWVPDGAPEEEFIENQCVKIYVPKRCHKCDTELVVGKDTSCANSMSYTESTLSYADCIHYNTYPNIYRNRLIVTLPPKPIVFDNCTKCGFNYPYGGPALCQQCKIWKVVGAQ